jgi:hypothetical protein
VGFRKFLGVPEQPPDPPRLTDLAELETPGHPRHHLLLRNAEATTESRAPASPNRKSPEILTASKKGPTRRGLSRQRRPRAYVWLSERSRAARSEAVDFYNLRF